MTTTKDDATEQFLRDGIFRYAEAHATVASYEEAAEAKVREVARDATSRLLKKSGSAKVEGSGFCNGDAGGRVAYAHFPGVFGANDVTWEIGIWWAHPSDGNAVTVYAECWKGPDHLTKEQWPVPLKNVPGTWEAYGGGISLQLQPSDEIDAAFKRLLDEVADQSAGNAKPRR